MSSTSKSNSKERKHSDESPTFYADTDPKEVTEEAIDPDAPYGRLEDGSPITRPRQRAPQMAADPSLGSSSYSDVDNPPPQFVQPGEEPMSRRKQVLSTGELGPLQGMTLDEASKKIEDERAGFLYWQATQKKYYIYEFQGFNKNEGTDIWKPKAYEVYRLTTSQYKTILLANADVQDLFLARNLREGEAMKKGPNRAIIEAQTGELRTKCKLWFRMTDQEFDNSAFQDVRDMCDAAQLAQAKVPSYRKAPGIAR